MRQYYDAVHLRLTNAISFMGVKFVIHLLGKKQEFIKDTGTFFYSQVSVRH